MSWLSVLTVVGTALGGVGGVTASLAAVFRWVVPFMKERRLSRVTAQCLEAKGKADREYYHSLLRTTLSQSGERDLGIDVKPRPPRQRSTNKALASAAQSEPEAPSPT